LKIESIDLYHIGIKLSKYVNIFSIKNQLRDKLREDKYEVFEKDELVFPIQIIGKKDDVTVEINWPSSAINAKGKSPDAILKISGELLKIMQDIGFNDTRSYQFFEIISNLLVKVGKEPIDAFTKLLNTELPKPNEFLDNLDCVAMRFVSGLLEKSNEFFDILLETSSDRPKECIFIRSIYRTKDWEKLVIMHKEYDERICSILQSIGE
jgi:hypothetical protein